IGITSLRRARSARFAPGRKGKVMRFDVERALVVRLLDAIGVLDAATSDPKKTYGRETGADVEVRLGPRKIGVQVTEYHGDAGTRGSRVRAREESDAARNIIRAYAV